MARIRLQDIAEGCGCSVAVASRVINGSAGNSACRPELRARILEDLAKALDAGNFPEARAFGDRLKTFYNRRDKLNKKA